mmetsp:Transcript_7000/g.17126  ORF Transcript_7000/g.17126 Transcript_7000/m.17126 type:complete len:169 (-) Transcript_7000:85-591(-)
MTTRTALVLAVVTVVAVVAIEVPAIRKAIRPSLWAPKPPPLGLTACRFGRLRARCSSSSLSELEIRYNWNVTRASRRVNWMKVEEVPMRLINRPFKRTRENDERKVTDLMRSIEDVGLLEPIDVLEVDGTFYGFSGCHRFEAFERLGRPTIPCVIRKASKEILRMHMM